MTWKTVLLVIALIIVVGLGVAKVASILIVYAFGSEIFGIEVTTLRVYAAMWAIRLLLK